MSQADKLLSIARAEIGVVEDPIGSNKTKYGVMYGRNGVEWCVIFAWCCFFLAGLSHLFYDGMKTASSTTLMNWARSKGQFVTGGYQKGDVFCYQFDADDKAEHVGIYTGEKDARGRYMVIEGNHDNRVELVARTDSVLWGAFRPAYEVETDTVSDPDTPEVHKEEPATLNLPNVAYGDQSEVVRAMQILLIGRGFPCGFCAADGEFGPDTRAALKRFQERRGLTVNAICGPATWKKLLGINT